MSSASCETHPAAKKHDEKKNIVALFPLTIPIEILSRCNEELTGSISHLRTARPPDSSPTPRSSCRSRDASRSPSHAQGGRSFLKIPRGAAVLRCETKSLSGNI